MLFIKNSQLKQILMKDWRGLAIRYPDGHIRFAFGLSSEDKKKIEEIFGMIGLGRGNKKNGDIASPKNTSIGEDYVP